jgi:hypothetical protein
MLELLENKTLEWSQARGLLKNSTLQAQMLKLVSEIGELSDNIAKGNDVKDDIGDCLVVLTNLANMSGTKLSKCWEVAYNDIKDRKGIMNEQGVFIKETDPSYAKLVREHNPDALGLYAETDPILVNKGESRLDPFTTTLVLIFDDGTTLNYLAEDLTTHHKDFLKYAEDITKSEILELLGEPKC